MNVTSNVALLGAIGVILGALGTYFIAVRKLSGKIATSEAESLWTESKSIRDWSSEQLRLSNERILKLETRIADAEKEYNKLVRENLELQSIKDRHERIIEQCSTRLEAIENENSTLKETIQALLKGES